MPFAVEGAAAATDEAWVWRCMEAIIALRKGFNPPATHRGQKSKILGVCTMGAAERLRRARSCALPQIKLRKMKNYSPGLSAVFKNLGCVRGERGLFLGDFCPFEHPVPELLDRETMIVQLTEIAIRLGVQASQLVYPDPGGPAIEPPEPAWRLAFGDAFVDSLQGAKLWAPLVEKSLTPDQREEVFSRAKATARKVDFVYAPTGHSISHTAFSKLVCAQGGRVATSPGIEPQMFDEGGVMTADWDLVGHRTSIAARHLTAADTIVVETGVSRLTLNAKGRTGLADSGKINAPGVLGNIPGGESFIAPVEETAEGDLAIGPPDGPESVRFLFRQGRLMVDDIVGDDALRARLQTVSLKTPCASLLCEFGIGCNERARYDGKMLEAEKTFGTIHIAIGHNASFGGQIQCPFHEDFLVHRPTVIAISETGLATTLLAQGKWAMGE